jgi:hypothetical protein
MQNLFTRLWLWFDFKKYGYSELGNLGDITQFTFQDLSAQLKHMQIDIISQDKNSIRAKFEDQFTSYVLLFNGKGKFVSIEDETWKHFGEN